MTSFAFASFASTTLGTAIVTVANQIDEHTVYVLDVANHVHERVVQVGLEGSKLAEIKSGLNQGEHVIVGGQEKYQEGELVHPVFTPTPASDLTRAPNGMIDLHDDQGGEQ